MNAVGALPMQRIQDVLSGGFIEGACLDNVQPGSLDLTLTDEMFRVAGAFLPSPDETVAKAIKRVGRTRVGKTAVLERGACYVCRLSERVLSLPDGIYGKVNPKSSSGRTDVHIRLLADRVSRYDAVPKGYRGDLWALLIPKTFPVIARAGITLNQVRFFNQDTRLDQLRLETSFEQEGGFLYRQNGQMIRFNEIAHSDNDGSVVLTLGLNFETPGFEAFEAIESGEPIDLSLRGYYDPEFFFRPVPVRDHTIVLRANSFYILSTGEYIRVPSHYAGEMLPMDERSGELRSHYAGFIDPGWGIGPEGESQGRPLTLEVRSFDNGIIIRDGQPIAKMVYERLMEVPDRLYDGYKSHYSNQFGPKFSKHFK